jgi:hypothetical protein
MAVTYFIAVIQSDSGPGHQRATCCNVRDAFGEQQWGHRDILNAFDEEASAWAIGARE